MAPEVAGKLIADVKCYHCGHISGQVVKDPALPDAPRQFVPRPGFTAVVPRATEGLRCERCRGPVYLERRVAEPPLRLRLLDGGPNAA